MPCEVQQGMPQVIIFSPYAVPETHDTRSWSLALPPSVAASPELTLFQLLPAHLALTPETLTQILREELAPQPHAAVSPQVIGVVPHPAILQRPEQLRIYMDLTLAIGDALSAAGIPIELVSERSRPRVSIVKL